MITNSDIKKAARLARISFDEDKMKSIADDLNNIMNMIDTLQEVDTDNVEPMRSVLDGMEQPIRLDEAIYQDISDDLFRNVPKSGSELAKEVKCFVVPKVVE